ncbi:MULTISPECIES: heavy metal sensor histidine kinase [unclassified Thiomonas]|uniref:heavy metal sensor histidine kinase n=1 Tax=unclassified Thiomonas TaxID=2625466 RepID=UPI0007C37B58|nr:MULTISPECIES: heavy metal sensor histidine kinase [unclassified Thiomonas]CQR41950.1 Multi-sensor signal transduction histidine kinase [Thiomonas sp. CB3]
MQSDSTEAVVASRPSPRTQAGEGRKRQGMGLLGWTDFALRRLRQYGLPPRSLAAWMAGAFSLTLALILLAASCWVYWGLSARMMQEDRESVLRKLDTVAALLQTHPVQSDEVGQEAYLKLPPDAPRDLYLRLLDARGAVLLQTPGFSRALNEAAFLTPGVEGAPRLHEVHLPHDQHYLTALLPLTARVAAGAALTPMRLEVALNRTAESRILADYRLRLSAVLLAAILAAAAAGYGIAWRGLRPLRHMADSARGIGAQDLHKRLDTQRLPAELQTLALAFNATLQRLEESFGRISQFSADMAHELRTPITNLWGGLEVALGRPREPGEYREALESAVEECERLSQMIQTLLFLAQTEHPDAALRLERLDVAQELRTLADFFEATAAEAEVRLYVRVTPQLAFQADRMLLQRAMGNLIGNALAHTPRGGAVTLSAHPHSGAIRIEVADTGCGIAAEHLPYLFDRFYRADAARSRSRGGLGLGLALVRNIVRLHGGEVSVESIPKHGTRMMLDWPA